MQLTKAEEQVMQILWDMENGLVKDIRDSFNDPKPARNTVSTVLRVLEKKGFVGHKAYGNVHLYHPLVSKSDYSKSSVIRTDGELFQQLLSCHGIILCPGKRPDAERAGRTS